MRQLSIKSAIAFANWALRCTIHHDYPISIASMAEAIIARATSAISEHPNAEDYAYNKRDNRASAAFVFVFAHILSIFSYFKL
jgi:hypothetical protein